MAVFRFFAFCLCQNRVFCFCFHRLICIIANTQPGDYYVVCETTDDKRPIVSCKSNVFTLLKSELGAVESTPPQTPSSGQDSSTPDDATQQQSSIAESPRGRRLGKKSTRSKDAAAIASPTTDGTAANTAEFSTVHYFHFWFFFHKIY